MHDVVFQWQAIIGFHNYQRKRYITPWWQGTTSHIPSPSFTVDLRNTKRSWHQEPPHSWIQEWAIGWYISCPQVWTRNTIHFIIKHQWESFRIIKKRWKYICAICSLSYHLALMKSAEYVQNLGRKTFCVFRYGSRCVGITSHHSAVTTDGPFDPNSTCLKTLINIPAITALQRKNQCCCACLCWIFDRIIY